METITPEIADCPQESASVFCIDALGGILHDGKATVAGNLHDLVHCTGNAAVVNRVDRSCPVGDLLSDILWVDIQGILLNIRKYRCSPCYNDRIHG